MPTSCDGNESTRGSYHRIGLGLWITPRYIMYGQYGYGKSGRTAYSSGVCPTFGGACATGGKLATNAAGADPAANVCRRISVNTSRMPATDEIGTAMRMANCCRDSCAAVAVRSLGTDVAVTLEVVCSTDGEITVAVTAEIHHKTEEMPAEFHQKLGTCAIDADNLIGNSIKLP